MAVAILAVTFYKFSVEKRLLVLKWKTQTQQLYNMFPLTGVYLTNPLEIVPEETILEQLTSDSVLLVRRQDVVNRFRDWAPLNEIVKQKEEEWRKMNVLGKCGMWRNPEFVSSRVYLGAAYWYPFRNHPVLRSLRGASLVHWIEPCSFNPRFSHIVLFWGWILTGTTVFQKRIRLSCLWEGCQCLAECWWFILCVCKQVFPPPFRTDSALYSAKQSSKTKPIPHLSLKVNLCKVNTFQCGNSLLTVRCHHRQL